MKTRYGVVAILLFISAWGMLFTKHSIFSASPLTELASEIDLTRDSPRTLVATKSKDFTIRGLRLGLTHGEAWKVLAQNSSLVGFKDSRNPARIYVYGLKPDGSKGEAALYLIWEPGRDSMVKITVFQGFRASLSQNFKRLLTFEAVDDQSPFKREFIGSANRSKTTLNFPDLDMKDVTYYYDDIGLQVTHQHSSDGDRIVFSIGVSQPSSE